MGDTSFAASFKIFIVVCTYWIVSISLVFLNKYLLSSEDLKLDAPIFITWYQCVISIFVIFLLSFMGEKYPSIDKFPAFCIDLSIAKQILPLSVVFVGMITFNNLCLKYLDVAFYNVARALTTVFNIVFSYVILSQKTSLRAIGCCLLIILGFLLGVNEEGNMGGIPYKGVFFGVCGSLCVCLNAIYTKRSIPYVDGNIWRLQLYNNFNASLLFIPLMLFNSEHNVIINFQHIGEPYFWSIISMSGVFGIGIGYVTGLQIKVTSPLTHNISGTAKACVQTIIAVVHFATYKSALWWFCNFLVLGGSALYTYVKHSDMQKANNKSPPIKITTTKSKSSNI